MRIRDEMFEKASTDFKMEHFKLFTKPIRLQSRKALDLQTVRKFRCFFGNTFHLVF